MYWRATVAVHLIIHCSEWSCAIDSLEPPDTAEKGNRMTAHDADSHHNHTPQEERRIRDAALDQTIEASFPASDPPSSTPNPDDHTAVTRNRRREAEERSTPGRLTTGDGTTV
jgi:hypothetical protein